MHHIEEEKGKIKKQHTKNQIYTNVDSRFPILFKCPPWPLIPDSSKFLPHISHESGHAIHWIRIAWWGHGPFLGHLIGNIIGYMGPFGFILAQTGPYIPDDIAFLYALSHTEVNFL